MTKPVAVELRSHAIALIILFFWGGGTGGGAEVKDRSIVNLLKQIEIGTKYKFLKKVKIQGPIYLVFPNIETYR